VLLLPLIRSTYSDVHYSIYKTAYTSLILITLWYFLWQLWDIKQISRKWNALTLFGILITLGIIYSYFFGTKDVFPLMGTLFPIALFLTVQYALRSQQKASHLFLEKEQLQTENYRAQLKTLRTQVDPHFLFNSLNTLRSMVRQTHDQSEQFILSLSDFYRQTLKYSEEVKLALSEELKVLESYLFLMKKRNEGAVLVDMNIDPSCHRLFLPTLSLQIVVENCFKHNSMTSSNPLQISVSTKDGYIEVINNIQPKLGIVESTGNGLDLLIKRYQLMGVNEGVIVDQSSDSFSVKLKLLD